MALVPAKCTQRGGNIEVDDTHEAGICKFCGIPFVTEKAINNYTTSITNNIVNNNNINGANVAIQNDNYIDGLLLLTKRELELKYYRSKDLQKYLAEGGYFNRVCFFITYNEAIVLGFNLRKFRASFF